jgi:hypothetical protein
MALAWITSRSVSPISRAAWNMDGVSRIDGLRSCGALERSSSRLTTDWVVARLPAVISIRMRSPGTCQENILRNTDTLSTPALVRVSDMKTRPLFRRRPTQ